MDGCQADQHQVKAKFQEPVVVAALSPALCQLSQTFRKGFGARHTESGHKSFLWA